MAKLGYFGAEGAAERIAALADQRGENGLSRVLRGTSPGTARVVWRPCRGSARGGSSDVSEADRLVRRKTRPDDNRTIVQVLLEPVHDQRRHRVPVLVVGGVV